MDHRLRLPSDAGDAHIAFGIAVLFPLPFPTVQDKRNRKKKEDAFFGKQKLASVRVPKMCACCFVLFFFACPATARGTQALLSSHGARLVGALAVPCGVLFSAVFWRTEKGLWEGENCIFLIFYNFSLSCAYSFFLDGKRDTALAMCVRVCLGVLFLIGRRP